MRTQARHGRAVRSPASAERLWAGSVVVAGGLAGLVAGLRLVTGLLAVGQPAQWD